MAFAQKRATFAAFGRWLATVFALACCLCPALPAQQGRDLGFLGTFAQWSKVEVALVGPSLRAEGEPNPFAIEVSATFRGPQGREFRVFGFYDGDGRGGPDGPIWKLRFSPDAVGRWTFVTSSEVGALDGLRGAFSVVPPPRRAPPFLRWGRLGYVGAHYLKFAQGPYWLKGGTNEPEDFLAADVLEGWAEKRRAIDYLARVGVNSIYIMLNTVGGDGDNVWPWIAKRRSDRFDIAKLARWEELFCHIQARGIVLHLVFEDDSAWTGYNRPLYYREMIARFAHHNALCWNICEEYNERYTFDEVARFARMIRTFDPYDHPLTVHNVNAPERAEEMVRAGLDMTSIQTGVLAPRGHNALAIQWRRRSEELGRPLVVHFDEARPATDRRNVWAAYLGGAGWEAFVPRVREAGFAAEEKFWNELRLARLFMERLPLAKMRPANELVRGPGQYCLCLPGEVYAVYTGQARPVSLDLSRAKGRFFAQWYNPATGEYIAADGGDAQRGFLSGGGRRSFGAPPFAGDAALLVRRL